MYCFLISTEMGWFFPEGSNLVKEVSYLVSGSEATIFTLVTPKTPHSDLEEIFEAEEDTRRLFPDVSFKFKIMDEDSPSLAKTDFYSSRTVKLQ